MEGEVTATRSAEAKEMPLPSYTNVGSYTTLETSVASPCWFSDPVGQRTVGPGHVWVCFKERSSAQVLTRLI